MKHYSALALIFSTVGAQKIGDARIEDNKYPKGTVNIYDDGKWKTLISTFFGDSEYGASMICKQVGYKDGGILYAAGEGSKLE